MLYFRLQSLVYSLQPYLTDTDTVVGLEAMDTTARLVTALSTMNQNQTLNVVLSTVITAHIVLKLVLLSE